MKLGLALDIYSNLKCLSEHTAKIIDSQLTVAILEIKKCLDLSSLNQEAKG